MTKIIFPSSVNNHYQIVVQHNDNTFQIPTNLESIVLLLQNFSSSTPFGDGHLICNNYFLTILLPSFRFKRANYLPLSPRSIAKTQRNVIIASPNSILRLESKLIEKLLCTSISEKSYSGNGIRNFLPGRITPSHLSFDSIN